MSVAENPDYETELPLWREGRSLALLMATTLAIMANATLSPALPGIMEMFADHPQAELLTKLLVPAPSLTVVLFAPLAGWLADKYSRRGLLLWGVLLFALSGSAGLVLNDLTQIFISRLVLGVAVALIMTSQSALIGDYFTGDRRSAFMGLQISVRNFSGFFFITLSGGLALLSARLPFAIYLVAAIYLIAMFHCLPRTNHATSKAGGKLEEGTGATFQWLPVVLALAFLQLLTSMIFFLMPTQLPFFVLSQGLESAVVTGAGLGALTLTGGAAALYHNPIRRRFGHIGTFALGFGSMGAGFAALPLCDTIIPIMFASGLIGAGYAMVMPGFITLTLNHSPGYRHGLASGLVTTAMFLGQFLSPLASEPAIQNFGFGIAYWAVTLLLVSFVIVCLGLGLRRYFQSCRP